MICTCGTCGASGGYGDPRTGTFSGLWTVVERDGYLGSPSVRIAAAAEEGYARRWSCGTLLPKQEVLAPVENGQIQA